jgi:hypothetical protein
MAFNMRVDAQTREVIRFLEGLGTPYILLKGMARRAGAGLYPYADARRTRDVDLLLPEDAAIRAWQALVAAGYAPVEYAGPKLGHHHLMPLWNQHRIPVELHISTSSGVHPKEAWARSSADVSKVPWKGYAVLIPSATELLWHALSHAVQEGVYGFRLRHLLDAAAVLASAAPVNWDVILMRLEVEQLLDEESRRPADRRQVVRWLGCAARLAGATVPPELVGDAEEYPLEMVLRWELAVLQHAAIGRAATEKLLEEATRCEAGLPLTPAVRSRALPIRWRRRVAAAGARGMYLLWRTLIPAQASLRW